jgi:hypothetical protein
MVARGCEHNSLVRCERCQLKALRARVKELERERETADAIAHDHGLLAEENEVLKDRLTILRAVAEAADKHLVEDSVASGIHLSVTLSAAKEAGAL